MIIHSIKIAESCLVKKQRPRIILQRRNFPRSKRYMLRVNRKMRKFVSRPISRRMKGKQRAQNIPTVRFSFLRMRNMRNPAREALIHEIKLDILGMLSEKICVAVKMRV
jgi:hypothetical protein